MLDLRVGDCIELAKGLDDNTIDCTVTSPPYNKGGIGGGLGSWAGKALMPAGAGVGGSPLLKSGWNKLPWYQKMLATAANKYGTAAAATGIGAAAGAGASYMMGDPEEERRRQEEAMLLEDEKRKQRESLQVRSCN